MVVFKSLGARELSRILDIELNAVQQRIADSGIARSFVFTVTEQGELFLLDQGFDLKCGARDLKRAIERLVVHPMSNLLATGQIRSGDWIQIDHPTGAAAMSFHREAEGLPDRDMARFADPPETTFEAAFANNATATISRPGVTRTPLTPM
jgi:ATP-dependent Clp protease ATP-binding subunit ClpA